MGFRGSGDPPASLCAPQPRAECSHWLAAPRPGKPPHRGAREGHQLANPKASRTPQGPQHPHLACAVAQALPSRGPPDVGSPRQPHELRSPEGHFPDPEKGSAETWRPVPGSKRRSPFPRWPPCPAVPPRVEKQQGQLGWGPPGLSHHGVCSWGLSPPHSALGCCRRVQR